MALVTVLVAGAMSSRNLTTPAEVRVPDSGFTVDPDALRWLHDQITLLADDLRRLSDPSEVDARTAGDAGVAHAINHFVGNWRDGRQRLIHKLDQYGQDLAASTQLYQQHEDAATAAMNGQLR